MFESGSAFPKSVFFFLAGGSLIACGIYTGIITREGISLGLILRSAGFGLFGLLMMWGVAARQ